MGCWSVGLEYWVLNLTPLLHHSSTPVSNTLERGGGAHPSTMLRAIGSVLSMTIIDRSC